MITRIKERILQIDGSLFMIAVFLVCMGIIPLYSITINQEPMDYSRIGKQALFALMGLACMALIIIFLDYKILQNYYLIILFFGLAILISVLLFGTTIRGTRGWFYIAGISLQPVEIAKASYIIWLSSYFSRHYTTILRLKDMMFTGIITAIFVGLVCLQPDFGSALLFIGIWFFSCVLLKIPMKQGIIIICGFIIIGACSWLFIFKEYQKERLLTFINPTSKPLGSGYNVTQSIISIGSGNFFGRGLGLGPQSQLNFLPERESDFIFAVIGEELGFIGASIVLLLFGALFFRFYQIAKKSTNSFGTLLVYNFSILILLQVLINIGMNMGIMPVTGIPLPFVSAGGSALLVNLIMIGIIQSISMRNKTNFV